MKAKKKITFEAQCREFACAGFRGYRDNSPEAQDRRWFHAEQQHAYFKLKEAGLL